MQKASGDLSWEMIGKEIKILICSLLRYLRYGGLLTVFLITHWCMSSLSLLICTFWLCQDTGIRGRESFNNFRRKSLAGLRL